MGNSNIFPQGFIPFGMAMVDTKFKTHSVDSLLVVNVTRTKTHSVDASIRLIQVLTYSVNAMLQKSIVRTHAVNSILRNTSVISHGVDSIILTNTSIVKEYDVDAFLIQTLYPSYGLDTILRKLQTKTHGVDAKLSRSLNYSVNSILKLHRTLTHSVDSSIVGQLVDTPSDISHEYGTVPYGGSDGPFEPTSLGGNFFRYPALLTLAGQMLTDESRGPLTENRDERSVIIDLASGKKKKFIKSVRRTWTVSWDNVAMTSEFTVDGFAGRNEIRAIAQSADPMMLLIHDGRNLQERYTVFIDSYSDDVVMRYGEGDLFRYKLSLTLVEQG